MRGQGGSSLPADMLALLAAVLSEAPFGFALLDNDLRYLHINALLAGLNARAPEDHVGLTPEDVSPELGELVGPLLRQVLETGQPVAGLEFSGVAPGDGQLHHWLFNAYPVTHEQQTTGVAVAVIDLTDRLETVARLEAQADQQAAVVQLGMAALRGQDVNALVTDALDLVREVLQVDRTAILRGDAEGTRFTLEFHSPADRPVDPVTVTPGDRTLSGETVLAGEPIVSPDLPSDDRFDRVVAAGDMEVKSAMTVLIPGPKAPFGVLGSYHSQRRDFSADEIRFVQSVANVVGIAVERRRAEAALETSDQRLKVAQEAGRVGVWEWDLRSDVIVWSEALEHLYGLPTGGFDGRFETFRQFVHPDDLARVGPMLDAALMSGTYEHEHRIVRADTGEVRWIVARGETIRDDEDVPVRMVGINVDITERKLAEEERATLFAAERAARAAAESARERLTFLAEATGALSASLDYHETLQAVTRLAVPRFADVCVVDLEENGQLRGVAIAHTDPEGERLLREIRERYPSAVGGREPVRGRLDRGESVVFGEDVDAFLDSVAIDAEHLALVRRLHIGSGMIVPLVARGRVLGTLTLLRGKDREAFDGTDDLTLTTELARRVALAIDNARLFAEVSRTGERFRRMAETLQASLLPPNLPTVPGVDIAALYRAAAAGTAVGGDFYDVFPLSERGWGVVIGDVEGKGTEAATVTGIARHTIRTAAMRRGPVASLLVLNEALLQHDDNAGRFCTVLYGQVDTSDDAVHVQLASGGHPPALLRRRDGTVEPVGGGGTLMGVLDDVLLNDEEVALEEGDALVLYTDGVTEARGPQGEFGERRLRAAVSSAPADSAKELATAVERAVAEYSGGRFRDDIAILVLRADPSIVTQ